MDQHYGGMHLIGPPGVASHLLRPLVRLQGALLFRHERPLAVQRHMLGLLRLLPTWGVKRRCAQLGLTAGEWLLPPRPAPAAALLYLHGGGYCMGTPATHRGLAATLTRGTGLPTYVLDYRLAPEHPFPAALDDTLAAYRALRVTWGQAARIGLVGDSAGGGLALAATLALHERGEQPPAAIVAMSPWTDLACSGRSFIEQQRRDLLLQPGYVRHVAGLYLNGQNPLLPKASPLYGRLQGMPPLLLQVGADEILLDDSLRFAERAQAAGVAVSMEVWQGMWHVWQIAGPLLPEARRALARVSAFLRQHLILVQP